MRVQSVSDVVAVRAVRELRRAGASLQQVRKASRYLARHGASLTNARLYWDGKDVIVSENGEDLISALELPDQLVLLVEALPLGFWREQTTQENC